MVNLIYTQYASNRRLIHGPTVGKKFSKAFPTVKQQMKQRQIIEGKALKADEVVKLAKIDYNEAKEDKKNKRKQAKEQEVMVQKLDMQAAKRHRQGGNGDSKYGFSGHDYNGEEHFDGNRGGPGGYGWNRQSPPAAAFNTPFGTQRNSDKKWCTSCERLLKGTGIDQRTRDRLLKSIGKHTTETCIQPGGVMEGKTIEEAWKKADEIQAQEHLKSATGVTAQQVQFEQIEPADKADEIWNRLQSGLNNER